VSRDRAYLNMLDASTKIQKNIAKILEAQAIEAEKSSDWISNHFSVSSMEEHGERLKQIEEIHSHVLAVIDGLSKMEHALAHNLGLLVKSDSNDGSSSGMGDMFSLGDGEV
jgi:predicted AAA+ superfamily ATPase